MSDPGKTDSSEVSDWIRDEEGEFVAVSVRPTPSGLTIEDSAGSLTWVHRSEIHRLSTKRSKVAGLTDVDLVLANSSTVFLSLSESTLRKVVALLQSDDAGASAATSSDASLTEDEPDHSRAAGPAPKSRNVRYLVGLVALFLVAAVVGSSILLTRDSEGGDGSPSRTLRGAIAMRDGNQSLLGGVTECGGPGQNAIVSPGEGITARGGDGQILGTARLENPSSIEAVQSWVKEYRDATSYGRSGEFTQWMVDEKRYDDRVICTLFFEVELPAQEFYQLDIGSSGEILTLRQDELEATKWLMLITFD